MEGGGLWDDYSLAEILRALLWVGHHQAHLKETVSYQLPALINALEQWVCQNVTDSTIDHEDSEYWQNIRKEITRLRKRACEHDCQRTGVCRCT
jgi:hypothetical protein